MIAYKKQRRKVDPVKQILARLDEKRSKSGLSLYSRTDIHKTPKEDALPMVHPFNEANSVPSKNSSFFPDLSAARQKAHRRLNAGLRHAVEDSDHKAARYMQAKADKRLNLTFPPVKPHGMAHQNRQGYSFSGWSDSPSAGVENLRHSHHTSMNPFGYNRRTLAFQPTSLNYVVEWPETWPLKIMSLGNGTGARHKKKTKPKPKVSRRVHFENSPAPCASPVEVRSTLPQAAAAAPLQDQSKQVLPEMQNPEASAATETVQSQTPVEERRELLLAEQGLEANAASYMLVVEENQRMYSDSSSLSDTALAYVDKVKTSEVPDDTNSQQADQNTTRLSSVPPCTPTPTTNNITAEDKSPDSETAVDSVDLQEDEGVVEDEDNSQSLLMGIVSQIAAEPTVDYKQDI